MRTIRTILALEPGILLESLQSAFEQEPDIEIVCETNDPVGLLLAAREHDPCVVVMNVSDSGKLPAVGTHLLAEFPDLFIVGLCSRSQSAFTFRNAVLTEQITLGSYQQLVERLRSAATHPDCESNSEHETTSHDGATNTARTRC